jgi:ankyrin repeat protein
VQDGWTALHAAAENGRLECIQLLVDKGAEVDAADKASLALQLHHHDPCAHAGCVRHA